MKKQSQTDWEAVDALKDSEIDLSDQPELGGDFFLNAELRLPRPKDKVTIRLDHEVVNYFKAKGKGYQTRINAVLRQYVRAQKGS